MTDAELSEIESRANAATPGPWAKGCNRYGEHSVYGPEHEDVTPAYTDHMHGESMMEEDATFIAHAREDVPKLIAEIRRLNDVLAVVLLTR